MSEVVIRVEGLSKKYRLGNIGTGSLKNDLNQLWAKLRGKENPLAKVDSESAKHFIKNEFWALRDLNFEVKRGEAIGIIGKNGAGKSTLLKILSRVTSPTKGQIKIKGRIASLLEVGTGFHGELTGKENIFLNGAIMGMTKNEIKKKLDEIIAFSGVEQHIDTPVKRYSSGMYVRLAFAVAAHLEPEILIVDEVLAVGDAEFQKKCLGKMNQVASEGRTILFVSHNMASVKNLCSKGLLLNKGKILLEGRVDETVKTYLDININSSQAEVVWTADNKAPGNKEVQIIAVRVVNEDMEVSQNLLISEAIYVEIDYINKKERNFLSSNIQLFNTNGIGVFSSANWGSATSNVDPYSGANFSKGTYKSRIKIPANFLNEGTYVVNALILKDISVICAFANDVISFNVIDTGEMRKEYTGDWLGVVRPKLEWQTMPLT